MANSLKPHDFPFAALTNFALCNLFSTNKMRMKEMLEDKGISTVLSRKFNPLQMDTFENSSCAYHDEDEFNQISCNYTGGLSVFHVNIISLPKYAGTLYAYLQCLNLQFDVIMLSEIGRRNIPMIRYIFNDYNFEYRSPPVNNRGGVAIFVKKVLGPISVRDDLCISTECNCDKCEVESLFIDILLDERYVLGCVYRHPNGTIKHFSDSLKQTFSHIKTSTPVIICGDINIDFMKHELTLTKDYIDVLVELQLIPLVTIPTRITDNTCTAIDHIYIRPSKKNICKQVKSGVLYCDMTDHLPVFILLSNQFPKHGKEYTRVYSDRNINKFVEDCQNKDWSVSSENNDPNAAYTLFITSFTRLFNLHFPPVLVSKARQRDKKWVTKGLRECIQKKNILLKRKKKNPSFNNKKKYSIYNKVLQKHLVYAENKYYSDILSNKHDSNHKFWKLLGGVINPSKHANKQLINKITYGNKIITDPKEISCAFNDYFSNVGKKLSEKFPSQSDFRKYMKTNQANSIYITPIIVQEVITEISKLKTNKSSGPDNIPPKVIKCVSQQIAPILTEIFNLSLEQGVYPEFLKRSKVIALFKKGERLLPENYRPISLLDIFDKIFEKLIYKRLVSFINKYKMLFQFQFGFREDHSTVLALTEIIDNIKHAIDNNEYTVGIFIDLCKAFDTVDHGILLEKLKYYGIRGKAHDLLSSYLCNRTQYTVINNVVSDIKPITCGVPQGSVLGPLLFLIYINDIKNCISDKCIRLFADDTGLFVKGKSLDSVMKASQQILANLEEWFKHNKLSVSVAKCGFLVFHGKNRPLPNNIKPLYLNGVEIKRLDVFRYIGLLLDPTLSWKPHVENVVNKLNTFFGIFSHIRNKIPQHLVREIYFTTVFPHINYGLEIYGSCSGSLLSKLQVKQNQLMKILTKKDRLYPTDALHSENRILKIVDVFKSKILLFVHKCLNKNTISIFHNYFRLQHETHTYPTRDRNTLILPRTNTILGATAIYSSGVKLWNNCAVAKQNMTMSNHTMKRKVKNLYLDSYK